ncbi:MAG: hypothetical protein ABIY90_14795 [Puia sp.]
MPDSEFKIPFDASLYPVRELRAGNLTCLYENGNLRRIKKGQTEILRMIYAAVRNEHWDTASYSIENENIEQSEKSFRITYTAVYRYLSVVYQADILMEGKEDHSIAFTMSGKAVRAFQRNRIGLCVLHPVKECRGIPVTINHGAGKNDQRSFSNTISPHQLFTEIRQMDWTTRNNIKVTLFFEGDLFETEDQRNWMDESYKTYGTPLTLPIPVSIHPGERIQQGVILKVTVPDPDLPVGLIPSISGKGKKVPFPKIGFARNGSSCQLSPEEIIILRKLPFEQYRVEIYFGNAHWKEQLLKYISEARQLETKLELILFFTSSFESEMMDLLAQLKGKDRYIASILPLYDGYQVTPDFLSEYGYPILKKTFPAIEIGYGTDGHFTELNRQRPAGESFDFVSFSCHPQVHAKDTRTLMENLAALPDIIETIRSFTEKPLVVSPVSFTKRKKPDAANMGVPEEPADIRQTQWFGAAWTLLCLYFLHGADRISFYQTNGEHGIPDNGTGGPIYKVLSALKMFRPVWMQLENDEAPRKIIFENGQNQKLIFPLAPEYGNINSGNNI